MSKNAQKLPLLLSFDVDATFLTGIDRLKKILNFQIGDGIIVTAQKCDKPGVTLKDGKAVIYYPQKHLFFRELGLLIQHAEEGSFEIWEDSHFETLSVMIDTSRCGVHKVKTVYEACDYLVVMGYSMLMLYTEDTLTLENRPYFGYMRGRYTNADLKAIDDYAYEYGLEVIPCLELYGHMEKYLMWGEASEIQDTDSVMLAREEKTFQFVEELVSSVTSCFRSKRIHIGMDEAWDMGRGKFLTKNGYVPPVDIFNEYMERLIQITDKYGLIPMMWSDMYFRVNTDNNGYYGEDIVVAQSIKDSIPESVQLVFWHYGEAPYCDDYMIKKHKDLNRHIIYAGGSWGWIGHFPEHNYTMDACRFSLNACRDNDVKEAMLTIWTNDNAECDLFANLFDLSFFAELCFDRNASDQKLKERFEACTGADYEGFYSMCMYHNSFTEQDDYSASYSKRFLGKHLFWQDIMEGLYDTHLFEKPMSGHYAAYAQKMKEFAGGRWEYLYRFAEYCFDYLAVKTEIAEKLWPAYQNKDRETLAYIASTLLPLLKEKTVTVHEAHKAMWFAHFNVIGWQNLDIRYAGVAARCDTAKLLLDRYLSGEDDRIEELEEARLYKPLSGFTQYSAIATPNLKI